MYDTFGYWPHLPWHPPGNQTQRLLAMLEDARIGCVAPIAHEQRSAMVADLVRYFLIENQPSQEIQHQLAELVARTLLPGQLYTDPTVLFTASTNAETRGRPGGGTMQDALAFEFGFFAKNKEQVSERKLAATVGVERSTIRKWRKLPEYVADIAVMRQTMGKT